MTDAWYRASSGSPQCLFLSGAPGIGKTRLADEPPAWVAHQGHSTATAHCFAAEGSLTYTPVIAWLRSPAIRQTLGASDALWRGELARPLPELVIEQPDLPSPPPITQGWQRQRFFEALARVVLMQKTPLLMFIDDLQWADRDTIEWLHYLSRFDPKARLLLLATVRSEDVGHEHPLQTLLTSLRRGDFLTEVTLGPLSAHETEALALHLAGVALDHARLHFCTKLPKATHCSWLRRFKQRRRKSSTEGRTLFCLPLFHLKSMQ